MKRSKFPEQGVSVYPSPTGGRNERIGKTSYRRCVQCGFVNDTRTTAWAKEGDGLVSINSTSPSGEQNVSAGCLLCGSLRWSYSKPVKLPDDIYAEDPNIKKGGENE